MSNLLRSCLPWLNWRLALLLVCLVVGIGLLADLASWWVAATPLLAIAACVLPCLIPIVLLWRKNGNQPPTTKPDPVN